MHTVTLSSVLLIAFIRGAVSQNGIPTPNYPTLEVHPEPTHHPTPYQPCCDCTEIPQHGNEWCEHDTECKGTICTEADGFYSYCCTDTPDEPCLIRAEAICYDLPTERLCCSCTTETTYSGCPADIECQIGICAGDGTCCSQEGAWDFTCVWQAQLVCDATTEPSSSPSPYPTGEPTAKPTHDPTYLPTPQPTERPTIPPTADPTPLPTRPPTKFGPDLPSTPPSSPSLEPTPSPSLRPSNHPSLAPSDSPSVNPSDDPTVNPTINPSIQPSPYPSDHPSNNPSVDPSNNPTDSPFLDPTVHPSLSPSINPSFDPSNIPTVSPSLDPTVHPSVSPSHTPSVNPSNHPSINPSFEPTAHPSLDPTINPTHLPTSEPSYDPSLSPTVNPTLNPTFDPTADPTINPTQPPTHTGETLSPSVSPSTAHPSQTPTIDPTAVPTFIPTNEPTDVPTFTPTNEPTDVPILVPTTQPSPLHEPTSNPTNISIAPGCIDCDEYLVELIHIEEAEEEMIETTDCDYWGYKSHHWESDSSNGFRRRRQRHKRRKHKCTNHGYGWSSASSRRRLTDCNTNGNNAYTERIRSKSWYQSIDSSSDDSDDDEDEYHEICITYAVKQYDYDCGLLDGVFLSLCDTNDSLSDYNLTADMIDSIIASVEPDTLSANGAEINDALGIMIHINGEDIDEFKLCLKNVSVGDNYLSNDFEGITVSDLVVMNVDEEYKSCSNSDGLPCLNYVFSRKCKDECECNDGLKEIQTKYIGGPMAMRIVFYYDLDEIEWCIYDNMLPGEEMQCNIESTKYNQFESETEFIIFYSNDTECKGVIHSSCNGDISVEYCGELKVIGWKDTEDNVCIIPDEIALESGDNRNAFIDNDKMNEAFNIIAYEINANWRTEILIISCVLIGLVCIAVCYLVYSTRLFYKYNRQRPVLSSQVEVTDYDNDDEDDTFDDYVDTEDDEYNVHEYLQTDSS